MENEKNIEKLVKQLSEENENLRKSNAMLLDELTIYQQNYGDNWIHVKEYKEAINQAKEAKKTYDKASKEMILLKAKYAAKLKEMLEQYEFKK